MQKTESIGQQAAKNVGYVYVKYIWFTVYTYTVLLCPIVIIWYIVGELGSIVENAGEMGTPIPAFLKKVITVFKTTIDEAGDKIVDSK